MNKFKKSILVLSAASLLGSVAYAASSAIWVAPDVGPAQGTYRIPVDTSSSSGPGQISVGEIYTYIANTLNPVQTITGDGTITNNSASTGAVTLTLANAQAQSVLGNDTYSGAAPAYQTSIYLYNVIASAPHLLAISGSTFTPVASGPTSGNIQYFTLVHASCPCTIANPNGTPFDGQKLTFIITQSSSGSDTVGTYGSAYDFGTPGAPTLSTAANARDYVGFQYNAAAAKWDYLGSLLGH